MARSRRMTNVKIGLGGFTPDPTHQYTASVTVRIPFMVITRTMIIMKIDIWEYFRFDRIHVEFVVMDQVHVKRLRGGTFHDPIVGMALWDATRITALADLRSLSISEI